MQNFTTWVHGDAHARRYGYAAGNRLVDAYLAATGRTAAEALLVDSREVIETALGDTVTRVDPPCHLFRDGAAWATAIRQAAVMPPHRPA